MEARATQQQKLMAMVLEGSIRHCHKRRKSILYSMVALWFVGVFATLYAGPFTSLGGLLFSLFLACELSLFALLIAEMRRSYASYAKLNYLLEPNCTFPIRDIEKGAETFPCIHDKNVL